MPPSNSPVTDIVTQLKRDEGRRVKPYQDTQGIWSVGYGHSLSTGPDLSEAAITQILRDDIVHVETQCRSLRFWNSLSEPRRGALLNLAFNIGFEKMMGFRNMLAAIAEENWELAAQELLTSRYAQQVANRAHRLARQLTTDAWT